MTSCSASAPAAAFVPHHITRKESRGLMRNSRSRPRRPSVAPARRPPARFVAMITRSGRSFVFPLSSAIRRRLLSQTSCRQRVRDISTVLARLTAIPRRDALLRASSSERPGAAREGRGLAEDVEFRCSCSGGGLCQVYFFIIASSANIIITHREQHTQEQARDPSLFFEVFFTYNTR